jgi:hypothetical protein
MECDPHAVCDDRDGTAGCRCIDGYTGDGQTCTDVDECANGGGGCDENAVCVNLPGGRGCLCNEPFTGDGTSCADQDECADPLLNTCDPNAECSDTDSGFGCECNAGFEGDGLGCGDVDECTENLFTCGANSTCQNSFGGYLCPCDPLYAGDGKTQCQGLCDIARADTAVCHANGVCRIGGNSTGVCDACAPGYEGDGVTCTAAADCPEACDGDGTADIANTRCTGAAGARTCACAPGYIGDPNTSCADVPECATSNGGCGSNATCIEQPGGRFCDCIAGYELNPSFDPTMAASATNEACININECLQTPRPCHPDANCTDTAGDFSCACRPGYTGDGAICRDIDECQEDDDDCLGDDVARCVNTAGDYECRCRRGYTGDGVSECENLDECEDSNLNDCAENATCTDVDPEDNPFGYTCTCPEGLTGVGTECSDVNECLNAALNECEENATCVNSAGGYSCECRAPFAGDDPRNCYCDLSGYWAMRQDVDVCWCDRDVSGVTLLSGGDFETTTWELHKWSYDGDTIVTEKKACAAADDPDLISPLFGETYGSIVPEQYYFDGPLRPGKDVPEPGLVPGSMFTTPDEGVVDGIDIGPDLECDDCWPASFREVDDIGGSVPRWVDNDGDGEPGVTLWPRVPSDRTQASTASDIVYYSYIPANLAAEEVSERAGCVSVATRLITRMHATIASCERIVGELVNVKSEARVAGCTLVPESQWEEDITCEAADWSAADQPGERCDDDALMRLDEQDQSLNSSATFELVKIGNLDDEIECSHVRDELPAFPHTTPTPIDCNCPP